MKTTRTTQDQVAIPGPSGGDSGRVRGQTPELEEKAPYLPATLVFDESAMRALAGRTRGKLGRSSKEWLDETRGPVDEAGVEDQRRGRADDGSSSSKPS